MVFRNNSLKVCLSSVLCLVISSTATAGESETISIGNDGQIIVNSDSIYQYNEQSDNLVMNLDQGSLCFSVSKSAPLSITAGGSTLDLDSFYDDNNALTGMVTVDETGVYAGSTTTCDGISSVTKSGSGLFGLSADGTVLAVAGFILSVSLFSDSSGGDAAAIVVPPVSEPDAVVPPTGGDGGNGRGRDRRPRPVSRS